MPLLTTPCHRAGTERNLPNIVMTRESLFEVC